MPNAGLCRSTAIVLIIVAAIAGSAMAQPHDAQAPEHILTYFYKEPTLERLRGHIEAIERSPFAEKWDAYPPIAGFFAVVFRAPSDSVERLVPLRLRARTATTLAAALRLSGNQALAQKMHARLQQAGSDAKLKSEFANLPSRLEDLRIRTPTHLDILWGAAFASGDEGFVRMILDYMARTANHSEQLYRDMIMNTVKLFAPPDGRFEDLVAKYGEADARQVIYSATALWALESNARQHAFVESALAKYKQDHATTNAARALNLYRRALK